MTVSSFLEAPLEQFHGFVDVVRAVFIVPGLRPF
jgi:hypothetical protein